jgi:hypothetical protein
MKVGPMSENQTRVLAIELPDALIRSAKADAAKKGVTLKQWWLEAGKAQLPEKEQPGFGR